MNCPNCAAEMKEMSVERHLSTPTRIDVCIPCQGFWFDKYESLQLAPATTLHLIKFIGENSPARHATISADMNCPRCSVRLLFTHDMQRNTRFSYWRCANEHGRFITFFEFLKEKNFIRPLSPAEMVQLRKNIQVANCANCGAAIDLTSASACAHCGSPISILDMKQPQELLAQLEAAAEPKPPNPALPFELEMVKRDVERWFGVPYHMSDSEGF